jgi:hypothetical protein
MSSKKMTIKLLHTKVKHEKGQPNVVLSFKRTFHDEGVFRLFTIIGGWAFIKHD